MAQPLWTALVLACLWFSSVVFRIYTLWKQQNTFPWTPKAAHKSVAMRARPSRNLLGLGLGLCCFVSVFWFFKFQQERRAMFCSDSDLTSFFKRLQCNIDHFEVGKMQSCVSLLSVNP